MDDLPAGLRRSIRELVATIAPADDVEADHREEALAWIDSGAPLARQWARPVRPHQHLVSYFLVVDTAAGLLLLGDHVKAGLWLPSGGHVEPGEHPVETVRRECLEELALEARFHDEIGEVPFFVTVTQTRGEDPHRDVSLWFVLEAPVDSPIAPDPAEYRRVRWWTPAEVRSADPEQFDPHLPRMLAKLQRTPQAPGR